MGGDDPVEAVDLGLDTRGALEVQELGGGIAAVGQLGTHRSYGRRMAVENGAQGVDKCFAGAGLDAAHARHVSFGTVHLFTGIDQRHHPLQPRHRQADLVAAQVWAENARVN